VIFAEWKPVEEIVARLEDCRRVLVAGCATCVAECAAGGEKEVETMTPLLHMALQACGSEIDILTATVEKQCEWEFVEELAAAVQGVDAVVSLACGIGVQALAERFADTPVYPGVNTSALTIREQDGEWAARCAACGDCVLGDTFGFCPIARCAKSLLNGPCGGTRADGTCEIDPELDCVWALIVERAEQRGRLDRLTHVHATKDWSSSRHGGPKRVVREDLQR
jgi:hypothetical protein